MKKKTVLLPILCLLLMLTSCGSSKIAIDYFNQKQYSSTVTFFNSATAIAKNDGIYIGSDNTDYKKALSVQTPDYLFAFDDRLYFVTQNKLCVADSELKSYDVLLDENSGLDSEIMQNISSYYVNKNGVYVFCPSGGWKIDINKKSAERLIGNEGVYHYQFSGNDAYYIDHANREFSIYKLNTENGKKTLVVGEGVTNPKSNIIHNLVINGDSMFYFQREPNKIYKIDLTNNEKTDTGIVINPNSGNVEVMCISDNRLYYNLSENDDGKYSIYSYDLSSKNPKAKLEESDCACSRFTVIDGKIYHQN